MRIIIICMVLIALIINIGALSIASFDCKGEDYDFAEEASLPSFSRQECVPAPKSLEKMECPICGGKRFNVWTYSENSQTIIWMIGCSNKNCGKLLDVGRVEE